MIRRRFGAARRDEQGQAAIIMAFLIVMVLLLVGTAVGVTSISALLSAGRTAATSTVTQNAQGALSSVVSQVEANPSWFCPKTGTTTTCTLSQTGVKPTGYLPAAGWAKMTGGAVVKCTDPLTSSTACFHVTINYAAGEQNGSCGALSLAATHSSSVVCPSAATVLITVLSNCHGSVFSCTSVGYQAYLIRRNYLDYLEFINQQSLSPAAAYWTIKNEQAIFPSGAVYPLNTHCTGFTVLSKTVACIPALTGADTINGPIHTNGRYLYYCNTNQSGKLQPPQVGTSKWIIESTGTPITPTIGTHTSHGYRGSGQWESLAAAASPYWQTPPIFQASTPTFIPHNCTQGTTHAPSDAPTSKQSATISPPNFSAIKTTLQSLAASEGNCVGNVAGCYDYPGAKALYVILSRPTVTGHLVPRVQIYADNTYAGLTSAAALAGTAATTQAAATASAEQSPLLAYPDSGVIYSGGNVFLVCEGTRPGAVNGCTPAQVSGDVSTTNNGIVAGGLTIAAAGNVYVPTGNSLMYACDQSQLSAAATPSYSTSSSNCAHSHDELGLIAGGDILLGSANAGDGTTALPGTSAPGQVGTSMKMLGTETTQRGSQAIEAAMYATGSNSAGCAAVNGVAEQCGAVWSPLYDHECANPARGTYKCPELYVFGAIAGTYYPMFGAYLTYANSQNLLEYGFAKSLGYDSRLQTQQPPYFVQPAAVQWEQNSFTQVAVTTTCPGIYGTHFTGATPTYQC